MARPLRLEIEVLLLNNEGDPDDPFYEQTCEIVGYYRRN
jgi:hypothetical protein